MTLLSELIQINEVVEPVDQSLDLEEQMELCEQRMAAAKRGLGFANKLKNPAQKRKHMALVLGNLNKIRGNLTRVINQMSQFDKAAQDYEHNSVAPMRFDQGDEQHSSM